MTNLCEIVFVFTIAGLALSLSPTIFTNYDTAAAQEVSLAASTQAAESAGVFTMPQGDFAGEPSNGEPVVIPLRSPTPEAELQRLKELGGDSVLAPEVPADLVEPAPPCGHGGPESQ